MTAKIPPPHALVRRLTRPVTGLVALVAFSLAAAGGGADLSEAPQEPPEPPKAIRPGESPRPPEAPTAPRAGEPRPGKEAAPKAPEPGQLVNVRIDVTITDQRGSQPPVTKAVSVTVADRESGGIRSLAEAPIGTKTENLRTVPLDVDVRPSIEGNKIRLRISLQYNVVDTAGEAKQYPKLEIRESLGLVLESGKPLVAAESADPISDRRVSLEVKATILK